MKYCEIKTNDIANGLGVRVSLFVSGCTNRCKGCFQPETWDFNYGKPVTLDIYDSLVNELNKPWVSGLTLLGGDPMHPKNQLGVTMMLSYIRSQAPNKNVWIYTGYTYEELMNENSDCHTDFTEQILEQAEVLVDGRFIEEEKDISLKFRGSKNQRIIDISKTLVCGNVVLVDELM